jgi:hypothetical protein
MNQKNSKDKYISKYSNGKSVSAAQYITEIICEHLAVKEKRDLHYRFWVSPQWAKFYKSQIFTANVLLKTYNSKAILNALNNIKAKNIYSLRAPHLIDLIIAEQKKLDIQQTTKQEMKPINRQKNSLGKIQKSNKASSILDRLKDLDQ